MPGQAVNRTTVILVYLRPGRGKDRKGIFSIPVDPCVETSPQQGGLMDRLPAEMTEDAVALEWGSKRRFRRYGDGICFH